MSLADELKKLQELRDDGALSDAEFAQAKAKLLEETSQLGSAPSRSMMSSSNQELIGRAAMTWVSYRIVMTVIGLIFFLIIFFSFFLPMFMQAQQHMP